VKPRAALQAALLIVVLGALLVFAVLGAVSGLEDEYAAMNVHGWIALAIGAGVSILLGAGLMALVFFSAHKGYDDRVADDPMAPDLDEPRD